MSRNGSGVYSLPAGNPVTTGTTISSTWANNTLSDIATALTSSIAKDGQTTPTANIPMGGFRITGLAAGTAATDAANVTQVQNSTTQLIGSVSGGDTITGATSPAITAYAAGQRFAWIAASNNTTAVTLNVSSLGAKNLYKKSSGGLVALVAKDLISGQVYSATYDGTQFVLDAQRAYAQGADIASAGTLNLDTATGDYVNVTGTTTITAITLGQGEQRTVKFAGALTLTYGASLLLPTGASITTAANDVAVFRGEASGVVRCVVYTKADGSALSGGSGSTQIQPISASVAANALTISASALSLAFRSTTLGSGTVTTVTGTPSNLVISSGSTLGTTSAVASRIVVLAINNAGTIELAAVNITGGVDLSETGLISTTAEGGAGAADSASVIYSTTARSNVAYRVIGYIESTQATAGTWATAPSTIQGQGGQALVRPSSGSMVRLNTANGYGSTNTKIRRFTNTVTNVGSDITYADSATLGASFTINTPGVYAISATDCTNSANWATGLSLNTTTPTTNIQSCAVGEILAAGFISTADVATAVSWTGYLPAGSIIRAHNAGGTVGGNPNTVQFTIARVA